MGAVCQPPLFGDTFCSHGEGHMGPHAVPQGDGWLSPGLTLEQANRHPGYQKACARADYVTEWKLTSGVFI